MDERLEHPVPVYVTARSGYTIFVAYSDGRRGEVDLSSWSDKEAFRRWKEREFFESVHVDGRKAIAWGKDEDLDVCADTIYMMLTGSTVEEIFPRLHGLMEEHAWAMPSRRIIRTVGTEVCEKGSVGATYRGGHQ